jgi:hypothetical protein
MTGLIRFGKRIFSAGLVILASSLMAAHAQQTPDPHQVPVMGWRGWALFGFFHGY